MSLLLESLLAEDVDLGGEAVDAQEGGLFEVSFFGVELRRGGGT